jgi:hypothetical protein
VPLWSRRGAARNKAQHDEQRSNKKGAPNGHERHRDHQKTAGQYPGVDGRTANGIVRSCKRRGPDTGVAGLEHGVGIGEDPTQACQQGSALGRDWQGACASGRKARAATHERLGGSAASRPSGPRGRRPPRLIRSTESKHRISSAHLRLTKRRTMIYWLSYPECTSSPQGYAGPYRSATERHKADVPGGFLICARQKQMTRTQREERRMLLVDVSSQTIYALRRLALDWYFF